MVKHKQGRKKKRSFHDKQIALRNYLLKQKKNEIIDEIIWFIKFIK